MAEKILKTRIQLRYDTLANWTRNDPVLKAGEIAIATIPTADPAKKQLPPVMFKVGTYDGTNDATKKKFSELDWASALSADVYNWAKAANKPTYTAAEVGAATMEDVNDAIAKIPTVVDTDTQYQLVLSGHTLKLQSKAKGATSWTDVTGQTFELPDNNTTYTFAEGATNGAFSVTPSNSTTATSVKVHGLKSAAYTESSAYATAAQGDKADTALQEHQTVNLTGGTKNGTLKLTVGGTPTDNIAVTGLGTAAYTASTAYATAAQGTKADEALPSATFDSFKTTNTAAIAEAKKAGTDAQNALDSYKTTNDKKVNANTTAISNLETAVKSGVTFKGKVDALPAVTDYANGDLIIVGTKEYILSDNAGTKTWIELGDEGSHLTKATADEYYVAKNTAITGATKCKITYDSKGLVTKGENLEATDIPNLAASKITSGTFADERIASASTWNAKQNALSADQLAATNSGITADKVETYDGYATGKQNALSTTQLNAVNSGITSTLVTKYNGYEDIINGKQDKITTSNKLAASLVSGLAAVATSGSYNDLTDKPTIPTMPTVHDAALKDTSGQVIFTADASEDVTITVINCGTSADIW